MKPAAKRWALACFAAPRADCRGDRGFVIDGASVARTGTYAAQRDCAWPVLWVGVGAKARRLRAIADGLSTVEQMGARSEQGPTPTRGFAFFLPRAEEKFTLPAASHGAASSCAGAVRAGQLECEGTRRQQ